MYISNTSSKKRQISTTKSNMNKMNTKYKKGCQPGRLVPKATNVIAVVASFSPTLHPNPAEMSPMRAVIKPIKHMETKKDGQPPPYSEQ